METFAKKRTLGKLIREHVLHNKKVRWFSRMSVMANLLCFGRFAAE